MRVRIAVVALLAALAVGAAAENLVANGDFEDGPEPWSRPVVATEAHGGTHAVMLDNSAGASWAAVGYGPVIPLEPNVPYRLSVWVKRTTGDGYLEIGGYPVDAAGERLRTGRSWALVVYPIRVMTGQALGRWEQFETVFTITQPDLAGLHLRLIHRAAKDIIYFDDVAIERCELPPAPAWEFPEAVLFPGHPSRFGMTVEAVEEHEGGVRVTTTGAHYEFTATGAITARQRLGAEREVVSVQADAPFGELTVAQQDADACVILGDGLAFGVQGDSLVALATNRALQLSVTAQIGARHLATQGPHLLAIDEDGGFALSQDHSTRYQTAGCLLSDLPEAVGAPGWSFRYAVGERERVGLSVFPPRPYRWDDAFDKRIVNVTGPISDEAIRFFEQYCSVLMVFDAGRLYDNCREPTPGRGPYLFRDPEAMRRVIATCHELGMQVVLYSNTEAEGRLWYGADTDGYFAHLRAVTEEYGIDGWYFDGVFTRDPWSETYSFMRRVRELVGPDGIIYNHCTLNPPLTRDDLYLPHIDTYANFLLRGEGQMIRGVTDPYLRWVVGSYRISNAIPTLKWDKLEGASTREVLQAMLGLQGRARWAYPVSGPGAASWGANPPAERVALDREFLEYYFPELDRRAAQWRAGQLDESITWPLTATETRE